jgi:thioester reductase-like protein
LAIGDKVAAKIKVYNHCGSSEVGQSTYTLAPNGYAKSKNVAERLLDHAAQTRGIRTSFARVGQVAGVVRTFPQRVRSSLQIGAVPSSDGTTLDRIDWIPVDLLAEVLTALVLRESQPTTIKTAPNDVELHHRHCRR